MTLHELKMMYFELKQELIDAKSQKDTWINKYIMLEIRFNQLLLGDDADLALFTHIQHQPSKEWNIQHNLNRVDYLRMKLFDKNDKEIIGYVYYQEPNNIKVHLDNKKPFIGTAFIIENDQSYNITS